MKFQFKVALIFAIIVTFLLGLTGLNIFHHAELYVTKELGNKLMSIATIASLSINGSELEDLIKSRDEGNQFYKKNQGMLIQIRKATILQKVTDIYILKKTEKPNVLEFIIDTDESGKKANFGKLYDISNFPDLQNAFNGPTADKKITEDEWGLTLSGYAPIFSSNGTVLAILGVDSSAQTLKQMQSEVVNNMILFFVLGIVFSIPMSLMIGYFLSEPIKKLLDGTREVGKGNLEYQVKVKSRDEFGQLAVSFNQMVNELKEIKFIKETFEKYVSKNVAKKIMGKELDNVLSGERRHVTVLFTDVRGFTAIAENMRPEEVLKLLNDYFTVMIDVVFEYGGTLDKFMGDGIMAIFGAPLTFPNNAERAVRAALEMQEKLAEFSRQRIDQGLRSLRMGIGINSGTVVAGNIGSDKRKEYTVIGDTVNVAALLQSLAGEGETIISQSTYSEIRDIVLVEKLPFQALKGKTGVNEMYKIIRLKV